MALQESRAKIASSMRDLLNLWAETKVHWNDANSQRFEETYLVPLQRDVRSSANSMDQMASLLIQIRNQCE